MARQQRGNYLRQRPQPGAPKLVVPITWTPTWQFSNQINVRLNGSLTDLHYQGSPVFWCPEVGQFSSSVVFQGTFLEVFFAGPLPLAGTLELAEPFFGLGNTYGAFLAASSQPWAVVNAPLVQIEVVSVTDAGLNVVRFAFGTAGLPTLNDPAIVVVCVPSGENGIMVSSDDSGFSMSFLGFGINPGDQFDFSGPAPTYFNNTGGWLQSFFLALP